MTSVAQKSPEEPRGDFSAWFSNHAVVSTFLTSLLIVLTIMTFYRFNLQLCDDTFILMLSKGVGFVTAPEAMNTRLNIILSWFLTLLYSWFPTVQWYSVMLVSTLSLSFWGLLLAFQSGTQRNLKTLLAILSGGIYAYLLTVLQWTMPATIAAISSFFLLYVLLQQKKPKNLKASLFLATILILLSVGIRSTSVILVGLLALPSVLALRKHWAMSPEKVFILKVILGVLLIAASMVLFDGVYYRSKPEWSKAMSFGYEVFNLSEARRTYYDPSTQKHFDAVGWTKNDYEMFTNWYYMDENLYSTETLRRLSSAFPRFELNKRPGENFGTMFGLKSVQIVIVSVLLLFLLLPFAQIKTALFDVLWVAAVLVFMWVAFKIPERVFLPCLLFLLNLLILRATPRELGGKLGLVWERWIRRLSIFAIIVLAVMNLRFAVWLHGNEKIWCGYQDSFKASLADFKPDPSKLYVIWDSAFPYELIPAFDDFERFRDMPLVALAWFQRTPITKRMLDRFGVKDLFRDMLDNPNIYLICTEWEASAYQRYLIEKHGLDCQFDVMYASNFFRVYKIRTYPDPNHATDAPKKVKP